MNLSVYSHECPDPQFINLIHWRRMRMIRLRRLERLAIVDSKSFFKIYE